MTSARQLQNLDCAKCATTTLHTERGCVSCKTPHASQTVKLGDEWMREFVQRANKARQQRYGGVDGRPMTTTERTQRYRAKKRALAALGEGR